MGNYILSKWDKLPERMKNKDVKPYYIKLLQKKEQLIWKRRLDIILALILIVLLSPAMAVIAFAIRRDSKGDIFYRQIRITQYGKEFKIYKFRTMCLGADQMGLALTRTDDCRITKIGKILRKYRLDEFPQLFNVLKGDMTFVGQRPEVPQYVRCYTDEMLATLLLPAGITSLACIKYKNEDRLLAGNNDESTYIHKILPLKMKLNLGYLKKFSVLNDLLIMLRTVLTMMN